MTSTTHGLRELTGGRFLVALLACALILSVSYGCNRTPPPRSPPSAEQRAAELEGQRLRNLGALFSKDITRENLGHFLRPRGVGTGALVPDEDRVASFRGLRFDLDEFGQVTRIYPAKETASAEQ